jgi:hypothetical protein
MAADPSFEARRKDATSTSGDNGEVVRGMTAEIF